MVAGEYDSRRLTPAHFHGSEKVGIFPAVRFVPFGAGFSGSKGRGQCIHDRCGAEIRPADADAQQNVGAVTNFTGGPLDVFEQGVIRIVKDASPSEPLGSGAGTARERPVGRFRAREEPLDGIRPPCLSKVFVDAGKIESDHGGRLSFKRLF